MKYGCCVNMVSHNKNGSGADLVSAMKILGFDYAELSLSHLSAMENSEFFELKLMLNEKGLPAEACNNFFPAGLRLTGPDVDQVKVIRYLDKVFKICENLGIKTIVFGSGGARNVPPDFSKEEAVRQLAKLLSQINNYAVSADIIIAIEPLRKQECNIINTYSEALELKSMVNAKNIKCLLDSYHLAEEKESISVILEDKTSLAHVHFSEPIGRVFPGKPKSNYMEFFKTIKETGYNNRVSIDAYSNNFIKDAQESLQLLKEIESELKH